MGRGTLIFSGCLTAYMHNKELRNSNRGVSRTRRHVNEVERESAMNRVTTDTGMVEDRQQNQKME